RWQAVDVVFDHGVQGQGGAAVFPPDIPPGKGSGGVVVGQDRHPTHARSDPLFEAFWPGRVRPTGQDSVDCDDKGQLRHGGWVSGCQVWTGWAAGGVSADPFTGSVRTGLDSGGVVGTSCNLPLPPPTISIFGLP